MWKADIAKIIFGKTAIAAGFELMYRDWENIIHFSFFVKQFLSPSQKIIIPKQCIKKEIGFFSYHRNKNIFANTIKSDINMNVSCLIGTVFFLVYTLKVEGKDHSYLKKPLE